MKKIFLKAKHWHLFIAFFALPFILQMVLMYNMLTTFVHGEPSEESLSCFIYFLPVIILMVVLTVFGWNWSIATGLQSKIPQQIKLNLRLFRIFFFYPLIYILLFMGFMMFVAQNILSENMDEKIMMAAAFIFPLHLFAIFCIIYIYYFTAKTIKTAEERKPVSFSDFIGEFFMLLIFPIGVWIIQPRVNALTEK